MKKILLCVALIFGSLTFNTAPASAHYGDWHNATCQGQWWLMYNWPIDWNGEKVIYWTSPTGEMPLYNPELTYYAQQGYECGWMGAMIARSWIQQVCEFGYCGQGMITAFANGWIAKHFGGPYAGWLAVYQR